MNNFGKRAITGTLFVVVMLGGIMWNYWSLCTLFFIISMLGLDEFYKLVKHSNIQPQRWIGLALGALFFLMFAFQFLCGASFFLVLAMPFLALIFFAELYRKQETPFQNIAMTILGIIYVVLPFAVWVMFICPYKVLVSREDILMHRMDYSPHILLGFFFMLWTNDTGAYLTGMAFGKHKLWERISPKKTWEGFIGGVVLAMAIGYVISIYYKELNPLLWMILGFVIGVFGTLGDLVESLFKRSLNVKESGGLLPGHGGILDRFDGVLLSTYFVVGLLYITNLVDGILNS